MRVQEDLGVGSAGRCIHWCSLVGNHFITVNQEPQKIKFSDYTRHPPLRNNQRY